MLKAELPWVSAACWCETGLTGMAALVPRRLSPAWLWSGCSAQQPLPPGSLEPLPSNCD